MRDARQVLSAWGKIKWLGRGGLGVEHVAEEGESGGVGGVGGEEVSVERRKVVEDEACVVMFERLMAQKRMSLKA